MLKIQLSLISICILNLSSLAQIYLPLSILATPYENYYDINKFPQSNEKITFSLPHPFIDYKDSTLNNKTSYQYLMSLPLTDEHRFSEYVNYALLSLNFEQKFYNIQKGAEIWFTLTKNEIPTIAGIYYKNYSDSTKVYVITTFSLTAFNKKSKADLSKSICDRIKLIIEKNKNQKKSQHSP